MHELEIANEEMISKVEKLESTKVNLSRKIERLQRIIVNVRVFYTASINFRRATQMRMPIARKTTVPKILISKQNAERNAKGKLGPLGS